MEQWRGVVGAEDKYEVSDQGRVRSLTRRVRLVVHGVETTRLVTGRILKPGKVKSGHVSVAIGKNNSRMVHQLVLEAFTGPCPDGHETLHLNHTPDDNRHINLKWGTRAENVLMDLEAGSRTPPRYFNRWAAR